MRVDKVNYKESLHDQGQRYHVWEPHVGMTRSTSCFDSFALE
jgi:hypothetical protein